MRTEICMKRKCKNCKQYINCFERNKKEEQNETKKKKKKRI